MSFCTFGRRGGMRKSQMELLFLAQIAIPCFRGNLVFISSARAIPVPVIYRDVDFSRALEMKTGFPRRRGNAIRTANNNAICDFRIPSRRPKVQKRHTFPYEKVCLFALSGGAAGGGNRKWSCYLQSKWHFRVSVETRFSSPAYARNPHPGKSRGRESRVR